MTTELTQEVVLQFLTERGGRVRNMELLDYFKPVFPDDPETKAVVRGLFKSYVDNVAFVKMDNGVKFVCLKKKYRDSVKCSKDDCAFSLHDSGLDRIGPTADEGRSGEYSVASNDDFKPQTQVERIRSVEGFAECAEQEKSPVSCYGTDSVGEADVWAVSQEQTGKKANHSDDSDTTILEMGNTTSVTGRPRVLKNRDSFKCKANPTVIVPVIPHITVIGTSPLPVDGTMFTLPEYQPSLMEADKFEQVDTLTEHNWKRCRPTDNVGLHSLNDGFLSEANLSHRNEVDLSCGPVTPMDIDSREPEYLSSRPTEKRAGLADSVALSESNNPTEKFSRKDFTERMITDSPERRHRNTVYLSAGSRDPTKTDSDSASLTSSLTDEDSGPVSLDPLEHEWMICASDGQWQSLQQLLADEPSLVLKKDFITGFTCFHWAAKLGKPELLALIVNFAKQNDIPVDINAKSSGGYTPLHLATLHDHMEVVKLLVGAYDADVEVRDYNGKKASQYLKNSVTMDIQDITGAYKEPEAKDTENERHRQRFSKVLQSNFMSLQLPRQHSESSAQAADPLRQKPLRRKSTLSKLRPKLDRLSFRKQIVHSKTFHGNDNDEEDALKSPVTSRPKSNLFG